MKRSGDLSGRLGSQSRCHWKYSPESLLGVTVLAVSPDEADHRALRGLFDHTKWVLDRAETLKGAFERLEESPSPVVLLSRKLEDGEWTAFMERLPNTPDAPRVIIVAEKLTQEIYQEALYHGAFDVVVKPFKAAQLYPTVSDAWWQWKHCFTRSPDRALAASA